MFYLHNFLFIFSLRFGCRLIGFIEVCLYGYGFYYLVNKYGFSQMLESMIIISLGTSCLLSILMLISTLQDHESSGIIFTYLMWGIFTTIFLAVFYLITFKSGRKISLEVFLGLLLGTTIAKCYSMLVVLSFLHMMVSSDSEDSS
ncbi:uncharacterized protein LOC115763123 isoform X1 [Drosophila novamexicana]|uniref:uncharacterized protein LOC115763123 isoform X1 n=1 Tax=Drosophila novamexicana TaxID=47314 RepID=UPI0011E5AF7F|nr:uncharacterized protein LOC115763123 isoform X1 [Drosophila novamexicana]XP_030561425.1 uncharacterized protein LOC115763123 isoform X1 [Drosophila novamexicana]